MPFDHACRPEHGANTMRTSQPTARQALKPVRRTSWQTAAALLVLWSGSAAMAQAFPNLPITTDQRNTARQVAQAGVPLSELSPSLRPVEKLAIFR